MINKVGVDALAMQAATGLASTNIGAYLARTKGELALHVLELGQNLHRSVGQLLC